MPSSHDSSAFKVAQDVSTNEQVNKINDELETFVETVKAAKWQAKKKTKANR